MKNKQKQTAKKQNKYLQRSPTLFDCQVACWKYEPFAGNAWRRNKIPELVKLLILLTNNRVTRNKQ